MRNLLLFLILAAPLLAQSPSPMGNVGSANLPMQAIGVNDLVAISVYRSPELTRTVRVSQDGTIALPMLAEPIRADGLMPGALAAAISAALVDGGILVDPIVEVTVAEYASRPISVMGAVKKPLTFQAVGRVTLLDALARAEGLAENASSEVLVTVPAATGGAAPLIRRIGVKDLIDEADPTLNLVLHGGEEIRVPEAGKIFVVGNVKKPGAYAIPDPSDASVLTVIALAEGLTDFHRKQAYIYREEPDTGTRQEIEVELAQIMKRETPDIPLEVNDVLYIPDNAGKRTRTEILQRVAGFGSTTVSGVLIWSDR